MNVRSQSNENILTDMFRKAEEKTRKSRKRKRIMVEDESHSDSVSTGFEEDRDDVGLLRMLERERERVERTSRNNLNHQGPSNVGQESQLQQLSTGGGESGIEMGALTQAQKQKPAERVLGICCGVQHFAISCPWCRKDLVAQNGHYNKREDGRMHGQILCRTCTNLHQKRRRRGLGNTPIGKQGSP
jgi:hypothetical protein